MSNSVPYVDESGKTFRFLPSGDAPPRYSVMNFQRLPNGSFEWRPVGTYMRENHILYHFFIHCSLNSTQNAYYFCHYNQLKPQYSNRTNNERENELFI